MDAERHRGKGHGMIETRDMEPQRWTAKDSRQPQKLRGAQEHVLPWNPQKEPARPTLALRLLASRTVREEVSGLFKDTQVVIICHRRLRKLLHVINRYGKWKASSFAKIL